MNYKQVYAAFIEDRRSKVPPVGEYSESHHIVPRCLGGGDEPQNLIQLLPEDHFFAHLLLAKIHGGKLWAPVAFMVDGNRKDYRPTHSRVRYGWVCRAMGKARSGSGAHQFDAKSYSLINKDGREWSGLQSEFPSIGLSKSLGNMLLKGRVKCAKGWWIKGTPEPHRGGTSHPMYRASRHDFVHVDGRTFMGTQHDLHLNFGVSKAGASLLARGKASVWNGWYLRGATLPTVGKGKRWQKLIASAKT